jgi:hypothetical protein
MKPADRLAVRGGEGGAPNIPGLKWKYVVTGIWVGRLPQTNSVTPALPAKQ